MTSELEKLEKLDEHLVCATVAGRKRLGVLGVVSLPVSDDEHQNHVMFYDFAQNEQEPLLPIGTIQSTEEIKQVFGPWGSFFKSHPDFSKWVEQVHSQLPITPLSIARTYLCSTGQLQLPDSEVLVQQSLNQQSQGKPLGFEMNSELVEAWFQWALQEDENSRNCSRARKQLSQAIVEAANQA